MAEIKLDHSQHKLSVAVGISDARQVLIRDAVVEAIEDKANNSTSKELEAIQKAIPNLSPAEYWYIGYSSGRIRERMKAAGEAMRQEFEKLVRDSGMSSGVRSLLA